MAKLINFSDINSDITKEGIKRLIKALRNEEKSTSELCSNKLKEMENTLVNIEKRIEHLNLGYINNATNNDRAFFNKQFKLIGEELLNLIYQRIAIENKITSNNIAKLCNLKNRINLCYTKLSNLLSAKYNY